MSQYFNAEALIKYVKSTYKNMDDFVLQPEDIERVLLEARKELSEFYQRHDELDDEDEEEMCAEIGHIANKFVGSVPLLAAMDHQSSSWIFELFVRDYC